VCFSSAENSRFDAAQYTFFGKAPLEGLERGGLADDGGVDGYGGGFGGHDDGAYHLSPVGEEVRLSLSATLYPTKKAGFLVDMNCAHSVIRKVLISLVPATVGKLRVVCIACFIQS
jgi:hypothetical protein